MFSLLQMIYGLLLKTIFHLFMNTLWKLLVIRTNLDEDWACAIWRVSWKSIWRVEIFLFSIKVAYCACRSNAFLSICKGMIISWLELILPIYPQWNKFLYRISQVPIYVSHQRWCWNRFYDMSYAIVILGEVLIVVLV